MTLANFKIDGKLPVSQMSIMRSKRVPIPEDVLEAGNGYRRGHMQYHAHYPTAVLSNFRACLKSCSEMPGYGKHLL
jgi:hypothetical protein